MKIIFALTIVLFIPYIVLGQELNCTVTINTEGIPSAQRDYLRNFQSDIERYLNNTHFTNEDLDGEKIKCSIDIFFKAATGENRYLVQTFIGSQRPIYIGNNPSNRVTPVIRILDDKWEFNYMPNQRIVYDELSYDELTDFLDFYAYLIIGFDLETYVPMSGAQCFQKALNTDQIASSSPNGGNWKPTAASYSRFGIVDELNSAKYSTFRSAFNNYHFDGVDLLTTDQQKALDNILKAIESINDLRHLNPSSVLVKQFFDVKYKEIAEAFQNYPDREIYERLSGYDQEHRATYQEWKTK